MNYYEELGIRPDADEEEIRKAHRRLVKLMHPDQHRDAGLKALAETQMRRLNSIVATLLDPEERRDYDEELRGGSSDSSKQGQSQSTWRAVPWWIASTLGAIVLTVGTLWFFADRMGPSKRSVAPPEITETTPQVLPKPVETPAVKQPEEKTVVSVPNMPTPVPEKKPEALPSAPPPPVVVAEKPAPKPIPLPTPPPVVLATKEPTQKAAATQTKPPVVAVKQPPTRMAPPVVVAKKEDAPPPAAPPVVVTPPPVPVKEAPKEPTLVATAKPPAVVVAPQPTPAADIPKPEYHPPTPPPVAIRSHDPLEGEWVYAPTEPEKRRAGLYPPEFIQLRLVKDTSGMHGEYSARYNVDRSVSPDVNFVLKATDTTAMKYVWTAANGAHGWMLIRDLETDTMRLEWKDTSKHNGQQLTSGQATLVRKN